MATTKPWRRATASVSASLRRTNSSNSSSSRKTWRAIARYAELLRQLVADRLRRGARIEEQQAARLELAQHRLHAGAEGREAAAHVVVDADIAVEAVERRHHALLELGVGQSHQQRIRPGIGAAGRLHRQMQHQLVALRPRRPRLVAEILGVGQERLVSGPGNSQARFERGRSRPTSSMTMAISGRLLRSGNGTAFLRQVSALDTAAASCAAGSRGFSSSVVRGWPGSDSV